jgi:hypothetical protein
MTEPDDKPKPKVPLGKPLPLTDEDLDKLSQVTPEDIEKAKSFWQENASAKYKDLLNAKKLKKKQTKKSTK